MNKQEFEELTGKAVPSTDYEKIEFVYTWHPGISNIDGKKQIARIFKYGGMPIIVAMMEAATFAKNLDEERRKAEKQLEAIIERIHDVNCGCLEFERCVTEMRKYYEGAKDIKEFNDLVSKFMEPVYSVKFLKNARSIVVK